MKKQTIAIALGLIVLLFASGCPAPEEPEAPPAPPERPPTQVNPDQPADPDARAATDSTLRANVDRLQARLDRFTEANPTETETIKQGEALLAQALAVLDEAMAMEQDNEEMFRVLHTHNGFCYRFEELIPPDDR